MAEIKKYLDNVALGTLVEQIKAEDAKVLAAANSYAQGLGTNYDAAGSAATAESKAKSHADTKVSELENGQVKLNKEAIEKLNGGSEVEGSVAKAISDAKALIDADVDSVESKANKNAEDIAAINNAETGILKQAKDHTDTEIAKVQGDVDELKTFAGELPENSTSTTLVDFINEKTSGIATDTALGELRETVGQIGADLDTAEAAIDAIEADYLKATDKTELQANIDAVDAVVDKLVGSDTNKSAREIAIDVLTEALVGDNAKEAYDTLEEMSAWIQAHPEDATAMNAAIEALETLVGELPEGVAANDVFGYIQESVNAEKTRAEGVENDLESRLSAVEGKFGEGEGSVADAIADAVTEVKEYANGVASSEADAAEAAAKGYTDTEVAKDRERLTALEAVDHEHANKALLDTYAQTEENLADAVAKKHAHENADVLAAINAVKVAAWDVAEQNAKTYADGLNTAMDAKVAAVIEDVAENAAAIALKADKTALEQALTRIETNEAGIAANLSAINAFSPISSEDVNALFA